MQPDLPSPDVVTIGILGMRDREVSRLYQMISYLTSVITALQGAFAEHEASLRRLSLKTPIKVVQVRTVEDLAKCDALIIPGGGMYEA